MITWNATNNKYNGINQQPFGKAFLERTFLDGFLTATGFRCFRPVFFELIL